MTEIYTIKRFLIKGKINYEFASMQTVSSAALLASVQIYALNKHLQDVKLKLVFEILY